ncbi:uncharacterized protein QYS62_011198 [Fusarium acuminatum]|jgi:hypothetical protein|uniref:Uncharacterized protein n=1 Tax=Fusarium acuminatum TaxID=5515 RepID=A0ABZ2XBD5_9HYPO
MLHTFKTSSSPEVSTLIKKHGMTNALFIKNLSYFTNVALKDIDEISYKSMKTGVRYIVQALMDNTGLTRAEYRVLKFWSNQLAGDKIPFLTARAHTIMDARGKDPFSNYDLDFIHFVASSIKSEVASTNKTLADFAKEHGDILDLAYEVSKVKYKTLKFDVLGNLNAAIAEFAIASS